MQICSVTVRLRGDITQERTGKLVTVAEIPILRHIHGEDSVLNIQPAGRSKTSRAEEIERLKIEYGPELFATVYTGWQPKLAESLEDIGINPEREAKALDEQIAALMKRKTDLLNKGAATEAPKTQAQIFGDDEEDKQVAA